MNAELRRNLWLECTIGRMVAMPVILLVIMGIVGLMMGTAKVSQAAIVLCGLLVIFWGSRSAGDSVLSEVANSTWDAQRMSPLGPWSMSWAKLVGSTLYVWYGAAFCVAAFAWSLGYDERLQQQGDIARMQSFLQNGIYVQSLALFISLLTKRLQDNSRRRAQLVLAQGLAISLTVLFSERMWQPVQYRVAWYGINPDLQYFVPLMELGLTAWAMIGIYRLMRTELQLRNSPLVWFIFCTSAAIFVAGFRPVIGTGLAEQLRYLAVGSMIGGYDPVFWAFVTLALITEVAALVEPKNFMRLRQFLLILRARRWHDALYLTPAWAVSLIMAVALAVYLVADAVVIDPLRYQVGEHAFKAGFIMLFLMRDIFIIHLMTLSGLIRRGHLAALVTLCIAYGGCGIIAQIVDTALIKFERNVPNLITAMVVPLIPGAPHIAMLGVAVETAIMGGLLVRLWRRIYRDVEGAPAEQAKS